MTLYNVVFRRYYWSVFDHTVLWRNLTLEAACAMRAVSGDLVVYANSLLCVQDDVWFRDWPPGTQKYAREAQAYDAQFLRTDYYLGPLAHNGDPQYMLDGLVCSEKSALEYLTRRVGFTFEDAARYLSTLRVEAKITSDPLRPLNSMSIPTAIQQFVDCAYYATSNRRQQV